MRKENAIHGLTLNEIIEKSDELYYSLLKYHPGNMRMSKGVGHASNMEKHCLTIRFSVGGVWAKGSDITPEELASARQGFGVIDVTIWAYWGGHHYNGEPVNGTVYNTLICDRRIGWADNFDLRNEHFDFDTLKQTLEMLLA